MKKIAAVLEKQLASCSFAAAYRLCLTIRSPCKYMFQYHSGRGRIHDVADMKHVNNLPARAQAIEKRKTEKMAALASPGSFS